MVAEKKYSEAFEVLGAYQTKTPNNQEDGRNATGYILNEQQATFLLTLLKNTPVVVAFKKELVRQFYVMRSLLLERALPRVKGFGLMAAYVPHWASCREDRTRRAAGAAAGRAVAG